MQNTTNTGNTTNNDNSGIVVEVKAKLNALELPLSWAAKKLGYTTEYLRRLFTGKLKLSAPVMDALTLFKAKLEQMEKILSAT
jgi:hypothetical protein